MVDGQLGLRTLVREYQKQGSPQEDGLHLGRLDHGDLVVHTKDCRCNIDDSGEKETTVILLFALPMPASETPDIACRWSCGLEDGIGSA